MYLKVKRRKKNKKETKNSRKQQDRFKHNHINKHIKCK